MMLDRASLRRTLSLLSQFPAVALLGPRQVGKTTLARQIARQRGPALFLDLESEADRQTLRRPDLFLPAYRDRLVVLDEVQWVPELFTALRPEIDADRRAGRFLLLGSAAAGLLRQSAESLAGRIAYEALTPFLACEVEPDLATLQRLWHAVYPHCGAVFVAPKYCRCGQYCVLPVLRLAAPLRPDRCQYTEHLRDAGEGGGGRGPNISQVECVQTTNPRSYFPTAPACSGGGKSFLLLLLLLSPPLPSKAHVGSPIREEVSVPASVCLCLCLSLCLSLCLCLCLCLHICHCARVCLHRDTVNEFVCLCQCLYTVCVYYCWTDYNV